MDYGYCVMERRDYGRIDKLNRLENPETFWDDVRKYTKNIVSDHVIGRWQCLAEIRYEELETGMEKYIRFSGFNKETACCYEIAERPIN